MRPLFNQVSIVGLGLIGGSLGIALRRGRVARRVIGFTQSETTLRRAKHKGAVDDGCTELCPDWLGSSDLVVIATPPLSVVPIARQIMRLTSHRFLLTDVASTKREIVRRIEKILPSRIRFVGSHPMAGSERSGIQAADPDLFQGAACILTPTVCTDRSAVAKVSALWRGVGGRPVVLSPARHDALVAQISHVPHLAAAALVLSAQPEALELAAGGFTDATRIALSDPAIWSEICRTNRVELKKGLDRFIAQIERLKRLQGAALFRSLEVAQRKRRKLK